MKRLRVSLWIAGVCLAYWVLWFVFVFQDLYLHYDTIGFVLKMLAPVAWAANLVGVGLGFACWSSRRGLACLAVAMNALPLIGVLGFLWWLFFGVRI